MAKLIMNKSESIDKFVNNGIEFGLVEFLVEIFPSPIPNSINEVDVESFEALFRMSSEGGYQELFVPLGDIVAGESNGKSHKFSRQEFIAWQIVRMNSQTLYQLVNKTSANLIGLLDDDKEYDADPDYDPDGWLSAGMSDGECYEKALYFIDRLKRDVPNEFCTVLTDAILDPNYGVLEHLETEIDDNLDDVRGMYGHWDVPLMIVSKGKFLPYIEAGDDSNLMMDGYVLQRIYIRNYDEGDPVS